MNMHGHKSLSWHVICSCVTVCSQFLWVLLTVQERTGLIRETRCHQSYGFSFSLSSSSFVFSRVVCFQSFFWHKIQWKKSNFCHFLTLIEGVLKQTFCHHLLTLMFLQIKLSYGLEYNTHHWLYLLMDLFHYHCSFVPDNKC